MIPIRDYTGEALRILTNALIPYVESHLKRVHGDRWIQQAMASFRTRRDLTAHGTPDQIDWDAHALLAVMWDQWNHVFREELSHQERSLVSELREFRNHWAHQRRLNFDDSYRVLDSIQRLLVSTACEESHQIRLMKEELLEREIVDRINSEQQAHYITQNRRWVIGIYLLCCVTIIAELVMAWKEHAAMLSCVVIVIFVYLIYQRLRTDPVVQGPRECRQCRRVIYDHNCPYCGHEHRVGQVISPPSSSGEENGTASSEMVTAGRE